MQVNAMHPTFNLTTWSGDGKLDQLDMNKGIMSPARATFYPPRQP